MVCGLPGLTSPLESRCRRTGTSRSGCVLLWFYLPDDSSGLLKTFTSFLFATLATYPPLEVVGCSRAWTIFPTWPSMPIIASLDLQLQRNLTQLFRIDTWTHTGYYVSLSPPWVCYLSRHDVCSDACRSTRALLNGSNNMHTSPIPFCQCQ